METGQPLPICDDMRRGYEGFFLGGVNDFKFYSIRLNEIVSMKKSKFIITVWIEVLIEVINAWSSATIL